MRTLVWFRGKDLRVHDHAPLARAARDGETFPLFVVDPYFFAKARARELPHRMQLLLDGLRELERSIAERGSKLVVVEGKSVDIVPRIARELEVDRVLAYRWTEPVGRERDARVAAALGDVRFELEEGETLATPGSVLTKSGTPFLVFGAFARAFANSVDIAAPKRAPTKLPKVPARLGLGEVPIPTLEDLGLKRNERLVEGGEDAARKRLALFLKMAGAKYDVERDRLDHDGTSRLSQDLKFGTLSPATVWHEAELALRDAHPSAWRRFSTELLWREFAYSILFHRPEVLEKPFRPEWKGFPWLRSERSYEAWAEGMTGYPVVDAAARQLLAEGFVPNRARMIAASFLAKHLLVDFRRGEAHYMKWLSDADWANNDLGWQWTVGCGVDSAPYFRVFNPIAQGEKFDPDGAWVRRWVPELAELDDSVIHRPWEASDAALRSAGIVLGKTYPRPIVDHAFARSRFLAAAEGHLRTRHRGS